MASTSPTHSSRKWTYDVFLSFRGEDIRMTFLDHLNYQLQQKRIRTFKDEERLQVGQSIALSLRQAIKESRFAIVVFSKSYASSTWCLDEVVTIMECKENLGQVVVPIFYHVEPSHVRKQTGSFAESFKEHEANVVIAEAKVNRWRKALKEAANIKGHDVKAQYNGYELACIKGVVDDIFKQLRPAPPVHKENLVGLEPRFEEISNMLEMSCEEVKLIGICGMGGIGKTTLARAVFAEFSSKFDGACFLEDIRENHSKRGMKCLQETLVSVLLKESSVYINDEHEGIEMIKERLRWSRVLIVLDDVDCLKQLEKLVGDGDWFCNGSRLIITTRDMALFRSFRVVVKCYKVKELDDEEALKLFSCHAFKKESPDNGFQDLSRDFVAYASGLPLALKLWGSFLCGRTKEDWESTLKKIKDIPDDKIKVLSQLKISFDGLDEGDKEIFLDIACFFRRKRRDYVEEVLKSCNLHPNIGISVLIERCLLFESYGIIDMHDLIHEMGLNIATGSPRSRRWRLDDLDNELEMVEGLLLSSTDQHRGNENKIEDALKGMKKLKMLIVESFGKINSSESQECFCTSIMDNLPSSLRVLKFSFYPSKLVSTKSFLDKLTHLDLSSSRFLLESPNFDRMLNLERLDLSHCAYLKEIHPSIGCLKKLIFLDLSNCRNLEKLPRFTHVSSLKFLDLRFCEQLGNFPEIQAKISDLVELDLVQVGIRELPSSIQNLPGLTKLRLFDCTNLVCLSSGLSELKNLKVLALSSCRKLESLSENLGSLISLEYLNLWGSNFVKLPESLSQLPRLQYLDIRNCEKLEELPELPATIRELYVDFRFAFGSNIDELAIEYSELYSVSFSYGSEGETFLAKKFVHFPFLRKTPFCVSYPTHLTAEIETNILRSFKYRRYESNAISMDLNLSWYNQNLVGFVVCFFSSGRDIWGPHSYQDIGLIEHCAIVVKLTHKDNGTEVLQTKCVIARPFEEDFHLGLVCFVYIPFSSLWPESNTKTDGATPNDYSRFEVSFMNFKALADWGCSLLYKREQKLVRRCITTSSDSDSGIFSSPMVVTSTSSIDSSMATLFSTKNSTQVGTSFSGRGASSYSFSSGLHGGRSLRGAPSMRMRGGQGQSSRMDYSGNSFQSISSFGQLNLSISNTRSLDNSFYDSSENIARAQYDNGVLGPAPSTYASSFAAPNPTSLQLACQICNVIGHSALSCPWRQEQFAVHPLSDSTDSRWYTDSGTSSHIHPIQVVQILGIILLVMLLSIDLL